MIDHLEIRTRQMEAMVRFYTDVLKPLDYRQKVDGATKGFGDGRSLDLFITEGEPSTHVHFAFAAPSRSVVRQVYEIARTAGHTLDREPALAPHIHPDYYAGYLRDPDGRLIEFTCQRAE